MNSINIESSKPIYSYGASCSDLLGTGIEQNSIYIRNIHFDRSVAASLHSIELSFMVGDHTCQNSFYPVQPKDGELAVSNLYFDIYTYAIINCLRVSCFDENKELIESSDFEVSRYRQKTELCPPLEGEVAIIGGPLDLSGHRTLHTCEFAVDLMLAYQDSIAPVCENLCDHPSFGAEVVAPADGVIVSCGDGLIDSPVLYNYEATNRHLSELHDSFSNTHLNGGNFIIIDHGNSEYSNLVHLKCNSIVVENGQRVRRGEKIAECGNSGYGSLAPHLHYQLVNSPDPATWRSLPFEFSGYNSKIYSDEAMKSLEMSESMMKTMRSSRVSLISTIKGKK